MDTLCFQILEAIKANNPSINPDTNPINGPVSNIIKRGWVGMGMVVIICISFG